MRKTLLRAPIGLGLIPRFRFIFELTCWSGVNGLEVGGKGSNKEQKPIVI